MNDFVYTALAKIEKEKITAVLCTIVRSSGSTPRHVGSKMIFYPDGRISGSVGGGEIETRVITESKKALNDGKPRLITYSFVDPSKGDVGLCGGEAEVFIEPLLPKATIIIIGCGHVGKALAHLAKWLGFQVAVSDDRVELCNSENIPDSDLYLPCSMKEIPYQISINNNSYIVLTTRGTDVDIEGLPSLLTQDIAFLGIIGSQRRWLTTKKALMKAGIESKTLEFIHSPIGLELNAETPEEIAVSIMSQIICIRNKGTGKVMKTP